MIISGYLYASANNGKSLSTQYNIAIIMSKCVRFIVPFSVVWLLELAVHIITDDDITIGTVLYSFITGGDGPGSYYFPVMLQFVIIVPMILKLVEKYDVKGVLICFGLNIFFEILKNVIHMSVDTYRLLVLKYIFVIAYGIYLFFEKQKPLSILHIAFSGLGGVIYYYILLCGSDSSNYKYVDRNKHVCIYVYIWFYEMAYLT